jgi:hypothetical protein
MPPEQRSDDELQREQCRAALLTQVRCSSCCSSRGCNENKQRVFSVHGCASPVQIVAEQRALLDAQQSEPATHPPASTGSARAACGQARLSHLPQCAGPASPAKLPSSPQRSSGRQAQEALAADWLSLRRSLDQLAAGLPPRQPCSTPATGSPSGHSRPAVTQRSVLQSWPQAGNCGANTSGTGGGAADLAVRIAGMQAALAAKEAELVRMLLA